MGRHLKSGAFPHADSASTYVCIMWSTFTHFGKDVHMRVAAVGIALGAEAMEF